MIREIYDNIQNKEDIRKNLIELKKQLKDENNIRALFYYIGTDYSLFYELLENDDAKIRKNTVLIMGELGINEFMQKIYEAYEKEQQLFVKSAYLTALCNFDYRSLLKELKNRYDYLTKNEFEESNMKHINEEIRVLSNMLLTMEQPKTHKFTGYHEKSDIILLTNRNNKVVTASQIKNGKTKEFNAGVLVKTNDLKELLEIRTYSELLFMIGGLNSLKPDPNIVAKEIEKSNLIEFLQSRHKGNPPFYFRIELKSKMSLDKKSSLTKKIATELEKITNRKLINTTSNYEFEIRLVENVQGLFNVLIKLYTIKDERFSYRKNTIATSISPVNAALCVVLAKDYLKQDAQILDPFCGVGTMLIERNKVVSANPMYGIDIFGEAIEKARINAQNDQTVINFINRDFFDFKHEYQFDEIITNMPAQSAKKDESEVSRIYKKFFEKAHLILKEDGIIIMHSKNKELVNQYMNNKKYHIEKMYELSKKERTYLFIIKVIV